MFRALSHRNYRLFWIGAFLSNCGTWMQAVAQGWLVLQLTNSAFWLGLDAFMATIPGFFLTLLGGVFARSCRPPPLVDLHAGGCRSGCAGISNTGVDGTGKQMDGARLLVLTGCCMALASPSYLAMTFDLVGREDLANAVALKLLAVSTLARSGSSAGGRRL